MRNQRREQKGYHHHQYRGSRQSHGGVKEVNNGNKEQEPAMFAKWTLTANAESASRAEGLSSSSISRQPPKSRRCKGGKSREQRAGFPESQKPETQQSV